MLLTAVIIILREVLEGALLFSVLLVLSTQRNLGFHWSFFALIFGVLGAVIYASQFSIIATWFDYVGQEIVNSTLHVFIVIFLTCFSLIYKVTQFHESKHAKNIIVFCMAIALALTIVIEVSEIILYLSAYVDKTDVLVTVILGGVLGTGIGISVGVLLYYSLVVFSSNSVRNNYLNKSYSRDIAFVLLAFSSASMLSQAVILLTQADWLPSQYILWDTSPWLAENSLMGQLLYAVIGYEATPIGMQLTAYITGLFLVLVLPTLLNKGIGLYVNKK